jgi:DNA-binding transcriptional regulator WhiA
VNELSKQNLAYIIGVALGDGNLSNPNCKATRLRITCDSAYPEIGKEIKTALDILFPHNQVSYVTRRNENCFDISVYSNTLKKYMPWKENQGSKHAQSACVPEWILKEDSYTRACLKGLIQTDGSIYEDRGYRMINFTNIIEPLARNAQKMIEQLGYRPHTYTTMQKSGNLKYTVRLSRDVEKFIQEIKLSKT